LDEIGPVVGVDARDSHPLALADLEAREDRLHAPPDSRGPPGDQEHEDVGGVRHDVADSHGVSRQTSSACLRRPRWTMSGPAAEVCLTSWMRLRNRRARREPGHAAPSVPAVRGDLARKLRGRRDSGNGIHGGIQNRLDVAIKGTSDLVVHPHTVATDINESRASQVREMAGHRRLRQPETVVEMADAHLVLPEESQNRILGQNCLRFYGIDA